MPIGMMTEDQVFIYSLDLVAAKGEGGKSRAASTEGVEGRPRTAIARTHQTQTNVAQSTRRQGVNLKADQKRTVCVAERLS